MNKPLRFSSAKTKLLWISDQHQQHQPSWADTPPLWKSRGFTSIGDHDSWIKDQWFKMVDEETVVFDLGDRVFSDPKGERFRQTTTWPGHQYFINGNHWSGQRQIYTGVLDAIRVFGDGVLAPEQMVYPAKINNLTYLGDMIETYIDGTSVAMQHRAPYLWAEIGAGGFALCGHSHGRCAELNPADTKQGRILDVSLDNAIAYNHTPFFSWDDIKRIMVTKPVVKRDHH